MNGTDLLAEFRKHRSEEAFGALANRYANLVFSVAKRRLNNASLAEEASQIVFISLAKSVPNVRNDAELAAWLHRTTINASISLWRSENRRQAREQHAAVMPSDSTDNAQWEEIAPIVDDALNELNDADRQVVLLRFFERRSMRDLGLALGISEDAAKMRVSRALDHLRAACGNRGVACAAGVLAVLLTERAVEAASAAALISLAALQIPAAVQIAATTLRAKLLITSALVAGIALVVTLSTRKASKPFAPQITAFSATAPAQNAIVGASAASDANATNTSALPDPAKLLRDAARARGHFHSGELEFNAISYNSTHVAITNNVRLKVIFDGIDRRFESFGLGYMFTGSANDDTNLQAQTFNMPPDRAVRAGFLTPFDSRVVTIYDGSTLLEYTENSNEGIHRADAKNPVNDYASYVFDPRCLGVSARLSVLDTVESCLSPSAQAAQLKGEESVDGISAWHVSLAHDSVPTDFWFEKAFPLRVLKCAFNNIVALSRYDDVNTNDVLPLDVTISIRLLDGVFFRNITRQSARFNIPMDPASWTIAGLNMQVGTPVTDDRLMRRIGYWNGVGLSEFPPDKPATNVSDGLVWRERLDGPPYSPDTLDAAEWIISNTPDGPDVQRAAELITNFHASDTNLVSLCQTLERVRPQGAPQLLQTLLEQNPSTDVRGNACFALAQIRQSEACYGANTNATVQAENLYLRVITDFGQVKSRGESLGDLARPQLDDLRHVSIGQPAPITEGHDLDGRPLSLNSYRGQIVLLVFWGQACPPETKPLLALLEQHKDAPIAILGVYCDGDVLKAKKSVEAEGMTWPTFLDGRSGPIFQAWHDEGWPEVQIIDSNGIIRARNVFQFGLPQALAHLLMQDNPPPKSTP